jgi:hypothetical protein
LLTSALCSISSRTTASWPFWAAMYRPVFPLCQGRRHKDRAHGGGQSGERVRSGEGSGWSDKQGARTHVPGRARGTLVAALTSALRSISSRTMVSWPF